MKNSCWIICVLAGLLTIACNQQQNGNSTAANTTTSNEATFEGCGKGKAAPAQPPMAAIQTDLLLKHYWVWEFCIYGDDPPLGRAMEGRWFQFKPDGTFEYGQWETLVCRGTWTISPYKNIVRIKLDAEIDEHDSEFEIQGHTTDEMSWVGTTTYKQSSMIVKAINLLTRPTRKQFGRE